MAYNVVNKEYIEDYLADFAAEEEEGVSDPLLLNHLMTALEKPLLQREDNLYRLNSLPANAPGWLAEKWNDGTAFYEFVPNNSLGVKLGHIRDWIKGAMVNEANWLKNTDDKGRPRKLLKLATLDQAYAEADKAMKLQAETLRNKFEKNTNFQAEEAAADIETMMTFDDGHRIIRMFTPAALKKESAFMGHCIGQGGYDAAVTGDSRRFYSLRDPQNKPHATFEVETENNALHQCKGKENTPPVEKYFPYVQDFVKRERFKLTEDMLHTGLIEQDGAYYDIFNLPTGFTTTGDLSYYTAEGLKRHFPLPEGFEVEGTIYTDFGMFNDVVSARRAFEKKFGMAQKKNDASRRVLSL